MLAAAESPQNPVGIIFTGSAATVVVTVMAWIVRKVVSGEVVPIPIKQLLDAQLETQAIQTKILERLLDERGTTYDQMKLSTEANFAVYEYLRLNGWQTPPAQPGTAKFAARTQT